VPADADAIARIHVAAWCETYRGLIPDAVIESYSEEKRHAQWRQGLVLGSAGPAVFVANDAEDALIGFGAAGKARDPALESDAEIYAVYLLQSAQGRGAGQALMQALFAAMAARGHRSVGLWVFTGNATARRFYERMGGSRDCAATTRPKAGSATRRRIAGMISAASLGFPHQPPPKPGEASNQGIVIAFSVKAFWNLPTSTPSASETAVKAKPNWRQDSTENPSIFFRLGAESPAAGCM
jgi:GNAT superfamily N-acetyltransferase